MTEKQKTCLTEIERENIEYESLNRIWKAKRDGKIYNTIPDLISLTEKTIMKKAVPKEDYEKLKKEHDRLEGANDLLYHANRFSEKERNKLKEREKYLEDTCDFWINKVRGFEENVKKESFKTISGDEFIRKENSIPKEEHKILTEHLRTYTFKAEKYEKLYREKIKDYDKLKEENRDLKTIINEKMMTNIFKIMGKDDKAYIKRKEIQGFIPKEKVRKFVIENYEFTLNEFIEEERAKSRMGSGDDMWYEQQIIDYINKQRPIWIEFMKFVESRCKKQLMGVK